MEAGIPPLDVLSIATRGGAEAIGGIDETGTVETGKSADLVVLSENPLERIANTRSIEFVLFRGERVPSYRE